MLWVVCWLKVNWKLESTARWEMHLSTEILIMGKLSRLAIYLRWLHASKWWRFGPTPISGRTRVVEYMGELSNILKEIQKPDCWSVRPALSCQIPRLSNLVSRCRWEYSHRDLVVLKHGHEDPRKYPNDWDPIIHFDMKNSNGMCMLPPSVLLVKIMVMKGFTVLAATPKHRKIRTLKSTLKSFNWLALCIITSLILQETTGKENNHLTNDSETLECSVGKSCQDQITNRDLEKMQNFDSSAYWNHSALIGNHSKNHPLTLAFKVRWMYLRAWLC